MGTINIKTSEDLKQLEGWTISKIGQTPGKPRINLILTHPLSENKVMVFFLPKNSVSITDAQIKIDVELSIGAVDIFEEQKVDDKREAV